MRENNHREWNHKSSDRRHSSRYRSRSIDRERDRHSGHPPERDRHSGHPPDRDRQSGNPPERDRHSGNPPERDRHSVNLPPYPGSGSGYRPRHVSPMAYSASQKALRQSQLSPTPVKPCLKPWENIKSPTGQIKRSVVDRLGDPVSLNPTSVLEKGGKYSEREQFRGPELYSEFDKSDLQKIVVGIRRNLPATDIVTQIRTELDVDTFSVPRKQGEGLLPLFDRPDIKDAITKRIEEERGATGLLGSNESPPKPIAEQRVVAIIREPVFIDPPLRVRSRSRSRSRIRARSRTRSRDRHYEERRRENSRERRHCEPTPPPFRHDSPRYHDRRDLRHDLEKRKREIEIEKRHSKNGDRSYREYEQRDDNPNQFHSEYLSRGREHFRRSRSRGSEREHFQRSTSRERSYREHRGDRSPRNFDPEYVHHSREHFRRSRSRERPHREPERRFTKNPTNFDHEYVPGGSENFQRSGSGDRSRAEQEETENPDEKNSVNFDPEYVPRGRAYFEHDNRDTFVPNFRGRGTRDRGYPPRGGFTPRRNFIPRGTYTRGRGSSYKPHFQQHQPFIPRGGTTRRFNRNKPRSPDWRHDLYESTEKKV